MRNPNPNTKGLIKPDKISPQGSAKNPVHVRIPEEQYKAWMSLPAKERNEFLRNAIAQKLVEKNLISA